MDIAEITREQAKSYDLKDGTCRPAAVAALDRSNLTCKPSGSFSAELMNSVAEIQKLIGSKCVLSGPKTLERMTVIFSEPLLPKRRGKGGQLCIELSRIDVNNVLPT